MYGFPKYEWKPLMDGMMMTPSLSCRSAHLTGGLAHVVAKFLTTQQCALLPLTTLDETEPSTPSFPGLESITACIEAHARDQRTSAVDECYEFNLGRAQGMRGVGQRVTAHPSP